MLPLLSAGLNHARSYWWLTAWSSGAGRVADADVTTEVGELWSGFAVLA